MHHGSVLLCGPVVVRFVVLDSADVQYTVCIPHSCLFVDLQHSCNTVVTSTWSRACERYCMPLTQLEPNILFQSLLNNHQPLTIMTNRYKPLWKTITTQPSPKTLTTDQALSSIIHHNEPIIDVTLTHCYWAPNLLQRAENHMLPVLRVPLALTGWCWMVMHNGW